VKSRMEAAFGHSFDRVRVHADSRSAQLSSNLNARAFTVGHDVAFAAGEYQPGTPIGDALIAHELAHVIQQGDGASGPLAKGETEYDSLEEDADVSAVNAMVSLWSGAKGSLKEIGKNAMPRLRSGLKLQRCNDDKPAQFPLKPSAVATTQKSVSTPCTKDERQKNISMVVQEPIPLCCTENMLSEIRAHMGHAKTYVDYAITQLSQPKGDDVSKALWDNFRIRPDDQRVASVLDEFKAISSKMGSAPFICRSLAEDPVCEKHAGAGFDPRGIDNQPYITICGHYPGEKAKTGPDVAQSLQNPDDVGKFLPERSWVKTMIHEHAHLGSGSVINKPVTGEFYKCKQSYPQEPEKNLTNADNYAWFALDISKAGFPCG
jgi:hypothetical protein